MLELFDKCVLKCANAVLLATNRRAVKRHRARHRRYPNVAMPQRFAEKMLWRKVVDHNPMFVVFSDKLATKEYVRRVSPSLATPETLWIGDDADRIPDHLLAGDVFVKTNHGFSFNYRIRGGLVDRTDLKKKTDVWLRCVHGIKESQWAYSKVPPKLFVERSIGDAEGDLIEISVTASNGRPILGSINGHNKTPNHWKVHVDIHGNPTVGPSDEEGAPIVELPAGLDILEPYRSALAHTRRLSAGVDYARFDYMWNGTTLYAGEITVYPAGGIHDISNPTAHALLFDGWDLTVSHFLTARHTGPKRVYAEALRRTLRAQALRRNRNPLNLRMET
jgi:hypothetical protein